MTIDAEIITADDQTAIAAFDYEQLESETRIVVQQKTGEIRERVESMRRSSIEIGQRLREVKARLKHGEWGSWLAAEFRWSDQTALNLINVAQLADQTPKILEFEDRFARSALGALAAPSTPEAARTEAIERAEAGEKITHQTAQQIIAEHKPAPKPAAAAPAPKPLPPPLPATAPAAAAGEEEIAAAAPALPAQLPPVLTPLTPAAPAADDQALIQAAAMLLYTRKLVALAQRAWDQLAQPHLDRNIVPVVALDEAQAEQAARLALASPALRAQAGMLTFGAKLTMEVWDQESEAEASE